MKPFSHIVALCTVTLFLGACGSNSSVSPDTSSVTANPDAPLTSVLPDESIPATSLAPQLTTINGESFDLESVAQEKPLALWFWAPG
ncbi:hypothetical protein HQ459_02665 [bacterium]|nr:hypothetical protein [bacterium]